MEKGDQDLVKRRLIADHKCCVRIFMRSSVITIICLVAFIVLQFKVHNHEFDPGVEQTCNYTFVPPKNDFANGKYKLQYHNYEEYEVASGRATALHREHKLDQTGEIKCYVFISDNEDHNTRIFYSHVEAKYYSYSSYSQFEAFMFLFVVVAGCTLLPIFFLAIKTTAKILKKKKNQDQLFV